MCLPVVPATQEAEAGESLKPGKWRLKWAEITPLHSSLGNRARLHLKEKGLWFYSCYCKRHDFTLSCGCIVFYELIYHIFFIQSTVDGHWGYGTGSVSPSATWDAARLLAIWDSHGILSFLQLNCVVLVWKGPERVSDVPRVTQWAEAVPRQGPSPPP